MYGKQSSVCRSQERKDALEANQAKQQSTDQLVNWVAKTNVFVKLM